MSFRLQPTASPVHSEQSPRDSAPPATAHRSPARAGREDTSGLLISRRSVLTGLAAGAVLALAACTPGGDTPQAQADTGYVAGDGSLVAWAPGDRPGPIDLVGTTYDGEEIDLAAWRGNVVVVNFWYAACPPCRAEAPDLNAIYEDYEPHGVKMLGINPRDDVGAAQAFERTFATPYRSLDDRNAQAIAVFEGIVPLQAMPSTVVLDRQGRVVARVLGQIDPSVLRGFLDDTLAEA